MSDEIHTRPRTAGEPMRGFAGRFVLALAASASVAIVAYIGLGTIVHDLTLQAGIATMVAVVSVGLILQSIIVGPLMASRAELEGRYQAAVAEALQDPLTGLGNHRAFQEELDRQVEHAQRYGVPVALVLLDLDEFKTINDQDGHAQGDRALADFGRLVQATIRRVDLPFRIGGDEFAILLPHTDAESARIVARRLLAGALQPPMPEMGHRPISFSGGVSAMPNTALTRSQLYSQADAALYAAKHAGRTDVTVFDASEVAIDSMGGSRSSAAIAEVIARGQLRPVYQPIVELGSFTVLGYEGLIRPVSPAPFADPAALFAAAASSGQLVALDMTCIETIVAGARHLPSQLFLSVNISPGTVESPEFTTAGLLSILARHQFPASRLVLELTEREPLADVARARTKLETCQRAGIGLALDDLGVGNAGLRLLSELRFDVVKVDLSLVQRSAPGAPSSAVVGSVVSFAEQTGALVIGEGVEHQEQVAQLANLGVRAGQGFFFGRPADLDHQPSLEMGGYDLNPGSVAQPMADWRQSIGLPTPVAS
jgi:diguanylate cyclase (GGDEF)-like protein